MNKMLWEKAVAFHGHECPGLAIGVRACESAMERLGAGRSRDEELVCIAENDACGVDAVQALLGCTLGKGNLLYKGHGKQAFTFINKTPGTAVRVRLVALNPGLERPEWQRLLLDAPLDKLFVCADVAPDIPERARIFASVVCETCGEAAAEHTIRIQDGKRVCLGCFKEYSRGW